LCHHPLNNECLREDIVNGKKMSLLFPQTNVTNSKANDKRRKIMKLLKNEHYYELLKQGES
jgi:hypothetical protein